MTRQVGAALPHESAVGHVTGAARYVDDLWPNVAHVAHAWPVQVAHAHARVERIDAAAARQAPGVLAVLTADDVPGENDIGVARRDEPLFPTEVCFAGHAVAWVIAETEEQARVAAGLVRVDCEVLDAILSIERAIDAGSFLTTGDRLAKGDAATALRDRPPPPRRRARDRRAGALLSRDQRGAGVSRRGRRHAGPLVDAAPGRDAGDRRPRARRAASTPVVVQCLRMGGAFGGKEVQANELGGGRGAGGVAPRPAGARAPDAPAGHGHDRQAPSVPGALPRRLRRRPAGCTRSPCSCSATAAGRSTSASRCWAGRCSTSTTATTCRTSRSSAACAAPITSRTPRSAASADRRACW